MLLVASVLAHRAEPEMVVGGSGSAPSLDVRLIVDETINLDEIIK